VNEEETVNPRRLARTVALQALYEIDSVQHPPERVLQYLLEENPLSEDAVRFLRWLVYGVLRTRPVLDAYIQKYAPEWPLEQIACVDRNILRLSLYEFTVGQTPIKVAISEAVELAKLFGSDSTPRFVNGVLGSLAQIRDEIALRVRAHGKSSRSRSGKEENGPTSHHYGRRRA